MSEKIENSGWVLNISGAIHLTVPLSTDFLTTVEGLFIYFIFKFYFFSSYILCLCKDTECEAFIVANPKSANLQCFCSLSNKMFAALRSQCNIFTKKSKFHLHTGGERKHLHTGGVRL